MKHVTGISHSPTGQAVVEISSHVLKERLIKQRENKLDLKISNLLKLSIEVNIHNESKIKNLVNILN